MFSCLPEVGISVGLMADLMFFGHETGVLRMLSSPSIVEFFVCQSEV